MCTLIGDLKNKGGVGQVDLKALILLRKGSYSLQRQARILMS